MDAPVHFPPCMPPILNITIFRCGLCKRTQTHNTSNFNDHNLACTSCNHHHCPTITAPSTECLSCDIFQFQKVFECWACTTTSFYGDDIPHERCGRCNGTMDSASMPRWCVRRKIMRDSGGLAEWGVERAMYSWGWVLDYVLKAPAVVFTSLGWEMKVDEELERDFEMLAREV